MGLGLKGCLGFKRFSLLYFIILNFKADSYDQKFLILFFHFIWHTHGIKIIFYLGR